MNAILLSIALLVPVPNSSLVCYIRDRDNGICVVWYDSKTKEFYDSEGVKVPDPLSVVAKPQPKPHKPIPHKGSGNSQ